MIAIKGSGNSCLQAFKTCDFAHTFWLSVQESNGTNGTKPPENAGVGRLLPRYPVAKLSWSPLMTPNPGYGSLIYI